MNATPRITVNRKTLPELHSLTLAAADAGEDTLVFQGVTLRRSLAEDVLRQATAPLGFKVEGRKLRPFQK